MLTRSQFDTLVETWHKETMLLSFHKMDHPSIKELLSHGKDIVPFLLDLLVKGETWLSILLLGEIIGRCDYIDTKMSGDYDQLRKAWIKWAQNSEYAHWLTLI